MERDERERYRSYLLRLWRAHDGREPLWRASTERVATGEVTQFTTLSELFAFLVQETASVDPRSERPETTE